MAIEGRLDWREWEAKDGSGKRQAVQIVANSVQFLGSRDGSGGAAVAVTVAVASARAATYPPTTPTSQAPQLVAAVAALRGRHSLLAGDTAIGTSDLYHPPPNGPSERASSSQQARTARRRPRRPRKYTRINAEVVDYKDLNLLRRFLSDKGKTRGRRVTGLSRRHQRQLSVAVKRAREIALLPYVGER